MLNGIERYWLPYSAGCLWAYAQQFNDIADQWECKELIFNRRPINEVADRMIDPQVCGFSTYMWNEQYNLAMAKEIKTRWPDCAILFGGPQVTGEYLKHEFVDTIMMGEGESQFVQILRDLSQGRSLPTLYPKQRIESLEDLPSPYTTGVFDCIIEQNPTYTWNAVFETNRGCPFQCTFCDWGSLTLSKIKKFGLDKVQAELDWFARNNVRHIFIADANFGIFRDRDLEISRMMRRILEPSPVDYVMLAFLKNSNETVFEIAKILGPLMKSVTVSQQSMGAETLKAIKRENLKSNDLKHIVDLSKQHDVPTYTDMLLGLPGETVDSWKDGYGKLLECGYDNYIDTFFTVMLPNSELASPATRMKYGIQTVTVYDYFIQNPIANAPGTPKETAEMITSTNSMSMDDMVESYAFAWVVNTMYINGYAQLTAKYCRYVHAIEFRTFFEAMLRKIRDEDSLFRTLLNNLIDNTYSLLRTGYLLTDAEYGATHQFMQGQVDVYHARALAFDLGFEVAKQFGDLPDSLITLQKNFLIDQQQPDSWIIDSDIDITNWTPSTVARYQITKRQSDFEPTYYHIVFGRRRGWLKNRIELVA